MEPVRNAGVIDSDCSPRKVAHNGTPVRIEMIVAVTCIVMLVVRLGLFLGPTLIAVLSIRIHWIDTGNQEGGKEEAK